MSHHILRDRDIVVHLPIMHLELQPHEVRQDRRRALLRPDGNHLLALCIAHDWKPGLLVLVCAENAWVRLWEAYGTMCGPASDWVSEGSITANGRGNEEHTFPDGPRQQNSCREHGCE